MLVKNRKTGVVLKATPRLVALAVRQSHLELIEDDDYVDMSEVRAILGAAEEAGEPGVEEILENLEAAVQAKLAEVKARKKAAEPVKSKGKEKAADKVPEPKPGDQTKDEKPPEPPKQTVQDDFSEIEAEVMALIGDEKDKDHKDRLETMARESFGVDLDKRKNLSTLKQEILDLIAEYRAG